MQESRGDSDLQGHPTLRAPTDTNGHVCLIYSDEEERREVVARFVEEGLRGGERVAYFADARPDDVTCWLAELGVELPDDGSFGIASTLSVYCPDGHFEVDRMLDYWERFHRESSADGFPHARATGETSWSREVPGGEAIIEYEARLNGVLDQLPVIALCQYDVRRFDGATILDVLRVHPVMLVGGQLVKNPYYLGQELLLDARDDA